MMMKMLILAMVVLRAHGAVNKCASMSQDFAMKGWEILGASPPTGFCGSQQLDAGETCTLKCDSTDPNNAFYPLLGNDFELSCPSAASDGQRPKGTTECLKLVRGSEAKRTYKATWDNSIPPPLSMLDSTYAWVGCNDNTCGTNGISCSPGQANNPCADQWMQIETEEVRGVNPFVQGVVTQGRGDLPSQYVTQFKVQVTQRNDGSGMVDVKNALDNTLLFDSSGTAASGTMVFHYFDKPYQAKFIKITVTADSGYRAMRAAYLQCGSGFSSGCTPRSCMAGEYGRIGACKECPNGKKTSAPSQSTCTACAPGKFNVGAKQSSCPGTCEAVPGAKADAVLSCTSDKNSRITACADGYTKTDGTAVSPDTCTAVICLANESVSSNRCVACANGKKNDAGDVASGDDTECEDPAVVSAPSEESSFPVVIIAVVAILLCAAGGAAYYFKDAGAKTVQAPAKTTTNMA